MTSRSIAVVAGALGFAVVGASCARHASTRVPPPPIISHATWETERPVGYSADASRRNLEAGSSLTFHDLTVTIVATSVDSSTTPTPTDVVRLALASKSATEERQVNEGAAFNFGEYHVAVVAIYGPGELGAGLVAIEVGTLKSIPANVASSATAGGADLRLRIPHQIKFVTLHHIGSPQPLLPGEDPSQKLRNLQTWGARDRNWWDLPYHFLIDLEGRVYEGRDYHFMGETNTTYDPEGHFLISIIGNYDKQEPTQAQLEAIADMMAWAISRYDLPLDRIGGHYNYAQTGCPGKELRKYLEDGTFKRMVSERLNRKRSD